MRILSKVALLSLCLLQGALLFASSSEELETLESGVEEEFEIVNHLTYEEKTDYINGDVKRQKALCLENTHLSHQNSEFMPFTIPQEAQSKEIWCKFMGKFLYDGHNDRSLIYVVCKSCINDLYALSSAQGYSTRSQDFWTSSHNICIDAWKRACFDIY